MRRVRKKTLIAQLTDAERREKRGILDGRQMEAALARTECELIIHRWTQGW